MEQRPELIDYLRILYRRRRLILGGSGAITALIVAATFFMTPYYTTEATIFVAQSKVGEEGKETARVYAQVASYVTMLDNNTSFLRAIEHFGLRKEPYLMDIHKFAKLVTVRRIPETDILHFEFSFPEPELCQKIAEFLLEDAIQKNLELNRREAIDAQVFIKSELERARVDRETLNQQILDYRKVSEPSLLYEMLKAFRKTFQKLDEARRMAEASVAESQFAAFGPWTLASEKARLQSLSQSFTELQDKAALWNTDYGIRKQILLDLVDRYKIANRVYQQLAVRYSEATVLVGSRSQDLKLLDVPFKPERRSWPQRTLTAVIASQVSLLFMCLAAFLVDYIAQRRDRLG